MTGTKLEPKCYSCIGEKCEKHKDCRQWLDQEAAKLRDELRHFLDFGELMKQ